MSSNRIKSDKDSESQLALDLPVENFFSREDLVAGSANAMALEMVDSWPDWPGLLVILAGPVGSGKSHIGGVWAGQSNAKIISMDRLENLGEDRDNESTLLLEDARDDNINEIELFHILNAKRSANASILITSRTWPWDWGIALPDLSSRLRAAQLVELGEPDDELLRQVLFKLFADRQLAVEAMLVDYLVVRMERSLDTAVRVVARIDGVALAQKRKITRQLAGEILAEMENE